ncbi:hypothetical protein OROMI_021765 [Orobanche minor]
MAAASSPSLAQEMLAPDGEGTKEGERPKQHSQQPIEPESEQDNAVESELFETTDTQINAIFDSMWEQGEQEQPKVDILSTTTDIHPIICKAEKLSQVPTTLPAPTIHAPLSSTTSKNVVPESGIPKVILNVRPVRRRYPAAVHRSPFRPIDVRPGRDKFEHFLSLDHGVRNVGLLCGVEKDFFNDTLDANKQLEADHIEAYLAVITSDPALAGIKNIHSTIAITSCYFMETADDVFEEMHKDRKQFDEPFNHKLFDNKTEEVVPGHLLERLCLFAEARQPNWGPNMKQWINCDKVVAMCNYKEHRGTLLMDFKKQKLVLYDSFQWIFEDHHITNRKDIFLPIARLLPQILKEIGYFEHHRIKKPILTQWELTLPPKTKNPFKQEGDVKCGLYALKYVEHILSSTPLPKHLRNEQDAHNYRDHVARTIYAHSTDEPIPMVLGNIP